VQPVDTGGAIVGRHDGSEEFLCAGDGARPGVGDFNVVPADAARCLFGEAVLRLEAGALLLASRMCGVDRCAQAGAEGVLLVS
jgi:hypothetical protein